MLLSDSIERKFIESIELDDWEIETDTGWKELSRINKTIEYEVYRAEFEDGLFLEGADTHIVIMENGEQCFIKNLMNTNLRVKTKHGLKKCVKVISLGIHESMYDPEIDSEDHLYYSNDILSHNTITVSAFLLYHAIFNRDQTIAVLANNATKSREILSRIKLMYEELPWWLKPGATEWNKGSISFSNGTTIFSGPTTSGALRGYSISILYLDEFAFVQNADEFYTSAYPVISSGETTKVIITSTPNGMNLFAKIWFDAENKKNSYHPILFTWKDHPKRDECWKEKTLKNMTKKQFSQEFNCTFEGSSNTLITGECLTRLIYVDPIKDGEHYKIYETPKKENTYVGCVDVSEGVGRDFSTIQVINVTKTPYEQVYVYRRNDISPWDFSEVVYQVMKNYNEGYLVVENNSIGKIVSDTLRFDYSYENLVSSFSKGSFEEAREFSKNSGVRMTKTTKSIGCSSLKVLIEENVLVLKDWETIQELAVFSKRGNSYQAEKSKFDDLVMPLVSFGWLSTQSYFEDIANTHMQEIVKLKRLEDDSHAMFGFFSDGIDD